MGYEGRCQCGAVSARIAGEPLQVRQCWCRQCQQIAAASPTHNAIFKSEDVSFSGDLQTYSYLAASGNTLTQSFGSCGTHIMAQSSARPHLRTLRVGFLEAAHNLRPSIAIWTAEAPDGVEIDPALEGFEGQPPPVK